MFSRESSSGSKKHKKHKKERYDRDLDRYDGNVTDTDAW